MTNKLYASVTILILGASLGFAGDDKPGQKKDVCCQAVNDSKVNKDVRAPEIKPYKDNTNTRPTNGNGGNSGTGNSAPKNKNVAK